MRDESLVVQGIPSRQITSELCVPLSAATWF